MPHETAILTKASAEQQRRLFRYATVEQLWKLDADFAMWAHANQLAPGGDG